MAGIFTRKEISKILSDENLTPEERTDQLFSLYGRAIDDGYVTKSAAQAAQAAAVEQAKADALKEIKTPDVKESAEYKALDAQFNAYRTMQEARSSSDYASVKAKFFDQVYGMIDRSDGAKPVSEQLSEIQKQFEEYFTTNEKPSQPDRPLFGAPPEGGSPTGNGGKSFMDTWGFVPPQNKGG